MAQKIKISGQNVEIDIHKQIYCEHFSTIRPSSWKDPSHLYLIRLRDGDGNSSNPFARTLVFFIIPKRLDTAHVKAWIHFGEMSAEFLT